MKHPLILLSGMGADARVFSAQAAAIPELVVAPWIAPMPQESLSSYAARLAKRVDPGEPCFVGGASFGGFVALEMIRHLDVISCFLIGSIRSPKELPRRITILRNVSSVSGALPFEVAGMLSKLALASAGALSSDHARGLLSQMSEADSSFLRWACRAVLEWKGTPSTGGVPIHHIHGQDDQVLPQDMTHPDSVVKGAGHALSMSHPQDVTEFLIRHMRQDMAK